MARRRGLLACAVTLASLPLALLAGSRPAGGASTEAGVPARGAAVFQARQCWSCHALDAAGSTGKSGPDLDRWLGPHAAQLEVPAEELAARDAGSTRDDLDVIVKHRRHLPGVRIRVDDGKTERRLGVALCAERFDG